MNYYRQYPAGIDALNRVIGYRVRPAWIWTYGEGRPAGLIVGVANDGISGVPGVLRLRLLGRDAASLANAELDAGHPIPHQVSLARLELPAGTAWAGLRLQGELLVKGVAHPVRWACREALEPDGSLSLRLQARL
jgi:hypothetical protein